MADLVSMRVEGQRRLEVALTGVRRLVEHRRISRKMSTKFVCESNGGTERNFLFIRYSQNSLGEIKYFEDIMWCYKKLIRSVRRYRSSNSLIKLRGVFNTRMEEHKYTVKQLLDKKLTSKALVK